MSILNVINVPFSNSMSSLSQKDSSCFNILNLSCSDASGIGS